MSLRSLLLVPFFIGSLVTAASNPCRAKAISPPPPKLVCAKAGSVSSPDYLAQFHASSPQACAANCLEIAACKSASYRKGFCSLYKSSVKAMGFVASSTQKEYFSDRGCNTLACPTSTTTSTKTVTAMPTASCVVAAAFEPGQLNANGGTTIANFCNTGLAIMQNDGNFVVYPGNDNSGPGFESNTAYGCNGGCSASFTSDGDFEVTDNDYGVVYSTNTGGQNAQRITISEGVPYIVITDHDGNTLFSS